MTASPLNQGGEYLRYGRDTILGVSSSISNRGP